MTEYIPYASPDEADGYFAGRAFSDKWNDISDASEKLRLLALASRLVDRFCTFFDPDSSEPCTYDPADPPEWLREAVCEEALHLVNLGKDPTQTDRKTALGIRSTDGTVFDRSFAADILCLQCREILSANGGEIDPSAFAPGSGQLGVGRVVK